MTSQALSVAFRADSITTASKATLQHMAKTLGFTQDKFTAPGPKNRPALVLRVEEFDVAGHLQADTTIAYGTSTLTPLRAGQFVLPCLHAVTGLDLFACTLD
jgi:hypothetical protein